MSTRTFTLVACRCGDCRWKNSLRKAVPLPADKVARHCRIGVSLPEKWMRPPAEDARAFNNMEFVII